MSIEKQQKSNETDVSTKRRTLLKGSAAAMPMVLTLRSGSALAQTSASCLDKAQAAGLPIILAEVGDVAPPLGTGNDTHVRAETSGRILTPKGGGTLVIVFKHPDQTGNDAEWFSDEDNTMNGVPFKELFFKDGPQVGQSEMIMEQGTGADKKIFTFPDTTTPCYVLCWVDNSGIPYSPAVYGNPPPGEAPVATASCMASIAAG